jgi:hypothetical protein
MDVFDAIRDARATHIRKFSDGSNITYYDNGFMILSYVPPVMTETGEMPPPYEALLFYWQVIRNRPDVTTWDDIFKALGELCAASYKQAE